MKEIFKALSIFMVFVLMVSTLGPSFANAETPTKEASSVEVTVPSTIQIPESTELLNGEVQPMILPALALRLLITTGAKKGLEYAIKYSASASQLQKKFKHAKDFGVTGNYNLINRAKFEDALRDHVRDSTEIYLSKYSGQDVFVFFKGDNFVYTNTQGDFISGWKYTDAQGSYHRSNGMKAKKR